MTANRECGFAPELNGLSMLGIAAMTLGTKPAYNEVFCGGRERSQDRRLFSNVKAIAEGTVRHLNRVGDPQAERPFISGCMQRTGMTVLKCRCLADAVRLGEPQVFRLMYDGRKQSELINCVLPVYMAAVSTKFMAPG